MRKLIASSSAVLMALCMLLAHGCGESMETAPTLSNGDGNLGAGTKEGEPQDGGSGPGDTGTITLCHIPPGNPSNAHTISVGAPALRAHLRHGDSVGACEGEPETPPDGGGSTPGEGGGEEGGPGGDEDGGPACLPSGSECLPEGSTSCCNGLSCVQGLCWPSIG
jgi:hypothetical protein